MSFEVSRLKRLKTVQRARRDIPGAEGPSVPHVRPVQRRIRAARHTCPCPGSCLRCSPSTSVSLPVTRADDLHEREADRIATEVLAAPHRGGDAASPLTAHAAQADSAPEAIGTSVDGLSTASGQPLESPVREDMEQRFGHDFSRVRAHTGPQAGRSAHALHANAYAVGRHIVFGEGRYVPQTAAGRRLIAHELTHVLQQSGVASISSRTGRSRVASSVTKLSPTPARIQRDQATADREVLILKGSFTGKETDEEVRLVARSKGWIVEGRLTWDGTNWHAARVTPATKREQAVAQVQADLKNVGTVGEGLPTGDDIAAGFGDDTTVYTGEEETHQRTFGTGDSETGSDTEQEKGKGEEGSEGSESGTGTNELDVATELASLLLDPGSLAPTGEAKSGESGSPVGSSVGFLTGWFAKALTVVVAVLTFLGGPIKKGLKKLLGGAKELGSKALNMLRNRFGALGGRAAPKMLMAPLNAEEQQLKNQLMREMDYTADEADALIKQARETPDPGAGPNSKGITRRLK